MEQTAARLGKAMALMILQPRADLIESRFGFQE